MRVPALLAGAILLTAAPSLASWARDETDCGPPNSPRYCEGTNYTESLVDTYLCGDSRLGPTKLPRPGDGGAAGEAVLANALFLYDRLGGLCPGAFIAKWFNFTSGWWDYPADNGFALTPDGKPIAGNLTLARGTLIDRFGGEGGNYVGPAGAPYMQRSLPPSNLVGWDKACVPSPSDPLEFFRFCGRLPSDWGFPKLTRDCRYPYNYHVYRVVKPLLVLAGPIAPWFGQPGFGVQYVLYENVSTLIGTGYLAREDPLVLLPRKP